jgi:hypothetical protein
MMRHGPQSEKPNLEASGSDSTVRLRDFEINLSEISR